MYEIIIKDKCLQFFIFSLFDTKKFGIIEYKIDF